MVHLCVLVVPMYTCIAGGINRTRFEEVIPDDDIPALLAAGVLDGYVRTVIVIEFVVLDDEAGVITHERGTIAGALSPATVVYLVVSDYDVVDTGLSGAVQGDNLSLVHMRPAPSEVTFLERNVMSADDHLTVCLEPDDIDIGSVNADGGIGIEMRRFLEARVGGVGIVATHPLLCLNDHKFAFVGADDDAFLWTSTCRNVENPRPVVDLVAVDSAVIAD